MSFTLSVAAPQSVATAPLVDVPTPIPSSTASSLVTTTIDLPVPSTTLALSNVVNIRHGASAVASANT
jgi:hypothetical protein